MNLKGGYVILDLNGYDLSIDEDNKITNEKTKELLFNFCKNFTLKPILLIIQNTVCMAGTIFNKNVNMEIIAHYTDGANYGFAYDISINLETNEVYFMNSMF